MTVPDHGNSFEAIPDSPWPEPGDRAFVAGNLNRPGVARLDWMPDRWKAYAEGYRLAAISVAAALGPVHTDTDQVVFPLIALWRHYLELKLKTLLPALRDIPDTTHDPKSFGHNLLRLWSVAEPALRHMCGDAVEFHAVREIVLEFACADPTGEYFRYPTTNSGISSLSNGLTNLDLDHLDEVMQRVAFFLDSCHIGAMVEGAALDELQAEAAQVEAETLAELDGSSAWQ